VATSLKITEMSHFNENHVLFSDSLQVNIPFTENLLTG
jgi:hypothetical protein